MAIFLALRYSENPFFVPSRKCIGSELSYGHVFCCILFNGTGNGDGMNANVSFFFVIIATFFG